MTIGHFGKKVYELEMKHPKYGENMLKSEFTYNALHIQNMYLICLANIRFNIQIFQLMMKPVAL